MKLRIANNLVLGAEFVTSTQAILAQKGKGKSYTAAVEAEELLDAGQLVVIVDPTDAHFGLRSSPDGRATGYPIAVFGGDHGDVQLEPGGGSILAEAIVRERFSAIICTETMTKGEELRFVGDFLETLYRKNREAMHLFLDEADIFCPQQPYGGEARTTGATDDIVRRGRKKGIGCTLITQRASVLNKNVLSQADMLIAMGCSHPLDLDAIDKWVRRNADTKLATEMMTSLPSLPCGEAWAWNPAQHLFKRVAIRQRHTFDSGATPKAGEKKREPKILAPVDIARLGQSMVEAVKRQKDNDPKHLQARIRELTAVLEKAQKPVAQKPPQSVTKTETRTIELLKPADLANLKKFATRLEADIDKLDVVRDRLAQSQQVVVSELGNMVSAIARAEAIAERNKNSEATKGTSANAPRPLVPVIVAKNGTNGKGDRTDRSIALTDASAGSSSRAEQQILSSLAWWESIDVGAPSNESVAFIAGYTVSGHFANTRGKLKTAGLLEYPGPGVLQLTEEGRRLAPPSTRPRTLEALHNAVFERLDSAKRKILTVLIDAYPKSLTSVVVAEQAGYTVSGHFANMRGRLSTLGLVTYPRAGEIRASDLLFPEALS